MMNCKLIIIHSITQFFSKVVKLKIKTLQSTANISHRDVARWKILGSEGEGVENFLGIFEKFSEFVEQKKGNFLIIGGRGGLPPVPPPTRDTPDLSSS
jgi:hypothetical protein